jgi:hypothetical protein
VVLDRPEKIPRHRSQAGIIPVPNAAPGIADAQSQWDSASLVNRGCPQGIVELNQSLGRSGGGMSGFDFNPLGAIVGGWV